MESNIQDITGSAFLMKKGHQDRDREGVYQTEESSLDDVKSASFLGLLFSANYCPPCKMFLQILKDFYGEVNIDKRQCEILYVPLDKSEEDFREHYGQMPWLSVPYQDERIDKLKKKYNITGIPELVIVDSQTGSLVTLKGKKDIHERGIQTIPDWGKLLELNRERAIKKKEEERLEEIAKQKKLQEQQAQQTDQGKPVVGASLNV